MTPDERAPRTHQALDAEPHHNRPLNGRLTIRTASIPINPISGQNHHGNRAVATEPKRARNLDPLAIDPGHNKLIFENPQVRVFRSTRNSGDREKWHEHVGAGRAVVLLSDLSGRVEAANGTFASMNGAPGDVFWSDGYVEHCGLNIGNRPSELIIVEVK